MDIIETVKLVGSIAGPVIAGISLTWQIKKAQAERRSKPRVTAKITRSTLEINYGLTGPTIFLPVSYRSEVKNAFVDRIEAIFTNVMTNETHVLEASDFLEYQSDPTGVILFPRLSFKEPFSPFGISTDRYENRTLLFYDPICSEKLYEARSRLLPLYNELQIKHPSGIPDEEIDNFNKSTAVLEAWTKIRDELYLRPGNYRVIIRTFVEDQQIDSEFHITINQEQYETLSSNTLAMVSAVRSDGIGFQYLSIYSRIIQDDKRTLAPLLPQNEVAQQQRK